MSDRYFHPIRAEVAFMNKVLLEYNHTHLFTYPLCLLQAAKVELSSHNTDV